MASINHHTLMAGLSHDCSDLHGNYLYYACTIVCFNMDSIHTHMLSLCIAHSVIICHSYNVLVSSEVQSAL